MATIDRAQGSRSGTNRNVDKVTASARKKSSRGSQSDDLHAKVGCLDCKRLEMTEEFKQTPHPTRLGKPNDRGKSRTIKIECENTDQKYMMLSTSKASKHT